MRLPTLRLPPEWGQDPVPPEHRRLRAFDYFVLWFSLGVGLLVLIAGALLTARPPPDGFGFGLSLAEAALVIGVGSVVGSAMLAAAGRIGAVHGVPTMVSLRAVLGRRGSYAPTALNVLQLVGWGAFEVMVMGEAAARISGQPAGSPAAYGFVVLFAIICAGLALGGPITVVRGWLERFAVWLVIASTAWITYLVFTHPPGIAWGGFSSGPAALLLGVDLVIAMPVSWWPLVCDYNRFAARSRGAFAGTFLGYAVANAWFFLLGAAMLFVFPGSDAITSLLALSLGGIALFLILVDETDNGFADLYSTAVSVQNVVPRASQRRLVLAATGTVTVVGLLLTALGGLSGAGPLAYETFLLLVGGAFVPLLGVLTSDVFLVRTAGYRAEEFFGATAVRWESIAAWAAGAFAYFYLWWTNAGGGVGWPTVTIGSSLPAFGTALGVHYALARWFAHTRSPTRAAE